MSFTKDIKIVNGILFCNFVESSKDIENKLKSISYSDFYKKCKRYADDNLEITDIPVMVTPFYHFILIHQIFPEPVEYIRHYFDFYKNDLKSDISIETVTYKGKVIDKRALIHRLLRTYPSLIRDYHFYHKLLESKLFDSVNYSINDDLSGKDIIITHNGKTYELSLYVETKRSIKEKHSKDTERNHTWVNEIKLPINLQTAYDVGDFKLYGNNFIEMVKNKVYNSN